MDSVRFYHLTVTTLEHALPRLLEKIYQQGHRCVVLLDSDERVEYLNQVLWSFDPASFLPHGVCNEPLAEHCPILLATEPTLINHPDVVMVCNGQFPENFENFNLCCVMFDGKDTDAVTQARQDWENFKKQGYQIAYWKQSEQGQWTQQ